MLGTSTGVLGASLELLGTSGGVLAPRPALASVSGPVPKRLRAIVARCLQPDPGSRYRDAAELGDDLARYRAGLAVSDRETIFDRDERWFTTYRTAILLVAAYLPMRTVFALSQR